MPNIVSPSSLSRSLLPHLSMNFSLLSPLPTRPAFTPLRTGIPPPLMTGDNLFSLPIFPPPPQPPSLPHIPASPRYLPFLPRSSITVRVGARPARPTDVNTHSGRVAVKSPFDPSSWAGLLVNQWDPVGFFSVGSWLWSAIGTTWTLNIRPAVSSPVSFVLGV